MSQARHGRPLWLVVSPRLVVSCMGTILARLLVCKRCHTGKYDMRRECQKNGLTETFRIDTFHPTGSQTSLIVSILSVGTFVGALAAGYLADIAGRKYGIALSCLIPFNLGVALQVAATSQPLFIAGRFFAGLGVGLVSVQVPMYQAETLPAWIRGFVIGSYQLCITIGLLLASLVNYATQNRADSGSYRIPLAIQFAW